MGKVYYCPSENKWEIWINLPAYSRQKIRYKYPNEAWQEVEGDKYKIERIYGGWMSTLLVSAYYDNCKILYIESWLPVSSNGFGNTYILKKLNNTNYDYPIDSTIIDIDPSAIWTNTIQFSWNYACNRTTSNTKDFRNGVQMNTPNDIIGGVSFSFVPLQYRFRILDINGNVVKEIIKDTIPQILVKESSCEFNEDNFFLWKTGEKLLTEHILIEEDSSLGLYGVNMFLRNEKSIGQEHYIRLIGSIYSPPECQAYPEVKVFCYPLNLRKCPDGTCPCIRNEYVCCYNSSGYSIERIPIEEYDFS